MTQTLIRYTKVLEIVGDIIKVEVPQGLNHNASAARFGDLALVEDVGGYRSLAQVIRLQGDIVALQVFSGTKG